MATDPLNRLCKWRTVLAGWHHGTRSMNSPGTQAMRDLMDKWLVMRAENSAIVQLLVDKGLVTPKDFTERLFFEADLLNKQLEEVFPGFTATDTGMSINPQIANETMKVKGFPP